MRGLNPRLKSRTGKWVIAANSIFAMIVGISAMHAAFFIAMLWFRSSHGFSDAEREALHGFMWQMVWWHNGLILAISAAGAFAAVTARRIAKSEPDALEGPASVS